MNIFASLSYLRFILFARVIPSFLVQRNGTDEFFTIEPRVNGLYKKFINNDGHATPLGEKCAVGQKSLAFVHWSWSFTSGKFLICDVQGKGIRLICLICYHVHYDDNNNDTNNNLNNDTNHDNNIKHNRNNSQRYAYAVQFTLD